MGRKRPDWVWNFHIILLPSLRNPGIYPPHSFCFVACPAAREGADASGAQFFGGLFVSDLYTLFRFALVAIGEIVCRLL